MARRSHVPKFGNWDSNDHMPFTAVFDNARQGRRPINPNDPSENVQGAGGGTGAPAKRYNINDPEESMETSDLPQQGRQSQGGQQQQPGTRPRPQRPNNPSQAPLAQGNGVAPQQRGSGGHYRRPSRENVNELAPSNIPSGGDNPAAYGGAGRGSTRPGISSPAWDARRKSTSGDEGHAFAPATPNKSRLRTGGNSGSRDEPATKGPSAVPRFGAWDAQDPGSGDGFTVIFNNARQEKIVGGPVNPMPGTPENNKASDLYSDPSTFGHSRGKQKKSFTCCRQM